MREFEAMDTDGDGVITKVEYEVATEMRTREEEAVRVTLLEENTGGWQKVSQVVPKLCLISEKMQFKSWTLWIFKRNVLAALVVIGWLMIGTAFYAWVDDMEIPDALYFSVQEQTASHCLCCVAISSFPG